MSWQRQPSLWWMTASGECFGNGRAEGTPIREHDGCRASTTGFMETGTGNLARKTPNIGYSAQRRSQLGDTSKSALRPAHSIQCGTSTSPIVEPRNQPSSDRVPRHGAEEWLEPGTGRSVRPVLRGQRGSNAPLLPDRRRAHGARGAVSVLRESVRGLGPLAAGRAGRSGPPGEGAMTDPSVGSLARRIG